MTASGIRTEWHLAELAEQADPFDAVVYSPGVTIDLTGSEGELGEKLVELLMREKRLYDRGLTCELKWGGQDCLTCPRATLDPEERRSVLCRLGKDQCTVEARYDKRRAARSAPVEELAETIDELSELGALPDDLAELLTSVGS